MVREFETSRGGFRGGRGGDRGRGRGGKPSFGGRGGRGGFGGGMRAKQVTVITPHRLEGIFLAKGKEEMLVTKSIAPGEKVYGEKTITIEV